MKKKFIQSVDVGGSIYGKRRRQAKRMTTTTRTRGSKKEVVEVYNKFYRNQVAALYRAIHSPK